MIKDFEKYIPSFYERDDKLYAFSDKHDEIISAIIEDIKCFANFRDPVKTSFIEELGEYLNAGILSSDSARVKREKVYGAVSSHKLAGTWEWDIKPVMDALTGGDSFLAYSINSSDYVILGGESSDPDYYWGTLGYDGIDLELGLDIIGSGDESVLPGVIDIDINIDSISESSENTQIKVTTDDEEKVTTDGESKVSLTLDIPLLVESIKEKIPPYFRVFIGRTVGGSYIRYDNGQIN